MVPQRLPDRRAICEWGFLQFLPVLNNPWNLATARRRAAPGCRLLALIPVLWAKRLREIGTFGHASTRFSQPPAVCRCRAGTGRNGRARTQPEQLSRQCAAAFRGRLDPGFNGRDGEWQASIAGRKRPDSLTIVAQTRPQDRLPDLAYVFAPLKHARLDYMVQKAVEMGASSLQPVLTRFTQVSRVNGERMRANVIEAAEQCGILSIAEVAEPVALDRYLSQREGQRLLVFCDEAADAANPLQALQGEPAATRRDRRPDRPRRRICRGRARRPAPAAANPEAFAGAADPARRHRRGGGAGAGAGGAGRLDRFRPRRLGSGFAGILACY